MLAAIICIAAVVLALTYLSFLAAGLRQRLKNLDAQLGAARRIVAALNDVLAQAPGTSS